MRSRSAIVDSPLGPLKISVTASGLETIVFADKQDISLGARDEFTTPATEWLRRYWSDPDLECDVELVPAPTEFQQRVRGALLAIPCGETRTYGQLAEVLGSSARAVGGACRRNPVPLLVPCHRVVATEGLGGYSGAVAGPVFERKAWLLHHESSVINPIAETVS